MKRMMMCGLMLAASAVGAYNDLAPYDNTVESAFWVTTGHAEVASSTATSVGASGLDADGEIDTRTFSEGISNVLTRFRTFIWRGLSFFIK